MDLDKNSCVFTRSAIEPKRKYGDYREYVRSDFWYSCAYCSITETEARGIRFELDHYLPRHAFPEKTSEFLNIVYSCEKCNGRKSGYFKGDDSPSHNIILRPDVHDPRQHFFLGVSLKKDQLEAKTKEGSFNIKKLDLNRLAIRRVRDLRRRCCKADEYISFGLSKLKQHNLDLLSTEEKLPAKRRRDRLVKASQKLENDFKEYARSDLLGGASQSCENTEKWGLELEQAIEIGTSQ